MEPRRNILRQIIAGFTAMGVWPATTGLQAKEPPGNKMFIHHVFFWLKDPRNPQARRQFEKGLQALIKIPQIQSSHLGIPVESSREVVDDSFTYSYLAFFKNKADQDIYQTHPVHLQFIQECGHLWNKVIVYDALDY